MSNQLEKVKERLRTDLTIQNRGAQKKIEKKSVPVNEERFFAPDFRGARYF